jgi:LuxR family quorum sensing-dependent transcriptional regulator
VLSLGREFNIHKGIVVPVPSPGGIVGLVWSAGPHFDERAKYTPYLHVLALNIFHRLRQLGAAAKRAINLTAREREVMSAVASGKTTWQIGYALRISRRVVEWHIEQGCAKLGATDIEAAVARLQAATTR